MILKEKNSKKKDMQFHRRSLDPLEYSGIFKGRYHLQLGSCAKHQGQRILKFKQTSVKL